MIDDYLMPIVTAVIALLSGAFGRDLVTWWRDRDKARAVAAGTESQRAFTDSEQARAWLRAQLDERDDELKAVREQERKLLAQVGELAALVARQDERINAQAARIDDLSTMVTRLGADYTEMKVERDTYRAAKHDAENRLTAELLRAQLAQRDLTARDQEIERLRGQIDTLTAREGPS